MIGRAALFVVLSLVVAASIWFLVSYRETLHCSQQTSFAIATFDTIPNEEEQPVPLVYADGYAVPLRSAMAVGLMILMFGPAVAAMVRVARRTGHRAFLMTAVGCLAVGFVVCVVPDSVIGERFRSLYVVALILAIAEAMICTLVSRASAWPPVGGP